MLGFLEGDMEMLEKLKPLALLLLRGALAVIFIFHGYPKLFGNAHETMQAFVHMGFPSYFAVISGVLEFFGGCMLIAGLFTRVAGLLLAGEMVIALWRVHDVLTQPMAVGNYQLPLVLAASAFTLACLGGGSISLDRAIFGGKSGARSARRNKARD
jgi:putative oxidoreductase